MYQIDGSTAQTTRESAFRSKGDATAVRAADAGRYVSKTTTDTSVEKSGERSYFAEAVGLLLMSAIALSGLEVFAHLWANTNDPVSWPLRQRVRCQTSAAIDGLMSCGYSAAADFSLLARWRDGNHAAAARVAQPITRDFAIVRAFVQWNQ